MSVALPEEVPARRKLVAWERLNSQQEWAAGADLPVMVRLGRVYRLVSQQLEDALGLSLPQVRILFEALEPDGVSQSALHKSYKIDPASITRTVQAMERDGLITRRADQADNRLMRVYITKAGRALTLKLPAQIAEFERHLVEGLSDAQILQLHTVLEHLETRLHTAETANKDS